MSTGTVNTSFAPIASNLPDFDNYFCRDCRRIVHVRKGSNVPLPRFRKRRVHSARGCVRTDFRHFEALFTCWTRTRSRFPSPSKSASTAPPPIVGMSLASMRIKGESGTGGHVGGGAAQGK